MLACIQTWLDGDFCLSFVILPAWGSPYIPFGISIYTKPLCTKFLRLFPLVLHDSGFTLELQMQSHCLEMDLLVGDGPGAENLSQLQFCMWLVAFPARGDHASPLQILTGWLMPLLVFCG